MAEEFKGVSSAMKLQKKALYAKEIKDYEDERQILELEKERLVEARNKKLVRRAKKAYVEKNATEEGSTTDDDK